MRPHLLLCRQPPQKQSAFNLKTFPFQLRCVGRKKSVTGRYRYIPYDKWEAEQTSQHNKTTRYYYLDNPLTEGEWRIFADLV